MKKKQAFVLFSQHFDIMWRRCFLEDFEDKGENYVAYADLQAFYIIDHVAIAEKHKEHKFIIESVAVLRQFVKDYPEYRETLARLFREGRLSVSTSGDNIIDCNMVEGESIIRNYLYGNRYLKEEFGYTPPEIMDRNDAFGNSAQLPQIARAFGCRFVANITYSETDAPYWRGLDGSTVYTGKGKGISAIGTIGGYYKYRPCPVCRGKKNVECPVCRNRRIDEPTTDLRRIWGGNYEKAIGKEKDGIPGVILVLGEEILPVESIYDWIEKEREKYDFTVIQYEDYAKAVKSYLDRVDEAGENEIHSSPEVNPNNTGVLVSRIKTKQWVRESEALIAKAEALASVNAASGKKGDTRLFRTLWEKLHYMMFHDAITGTHIDAAYEELMKVARRLRDALSYTISEGEKALCEKENGGVTVFNTTGVSDNITASLPLEDGNLLVDENGNYAPVLSENGAKKEFFIGKIEPFQKKFFRIEKDTRKKSTVTNFDAKTSASADAVLINTTGVAARNGESLQRYTVENEFLSVTADKHGIISVKDKRNGINILEKGDYYVGEYILEHDLGSPWTTLSPDRRRDRLAPRTQLVSVRKSESEESLTFSLSGSELAAYSVNGVRAKITARLVRGSAKLYFSSEVDFDTANHRLRIAFPAVESGKHIYDIPFGLIERKPYEDNSVFPDGSSNWAAANGDYPAVHFAGIDGKRTHIAVFNRGTPSYTVEKDTRGSDTLFLSVLRSPTVGTYLHDPSIYSMTAYEGMRDAGHHSFSYAVGNYDTPLAEGAATLDGVAYNRSAAVVYGEMKAVDMPRLVSDNAYLASVKISEDKTMLVYRIVEYRGKNGTLTLDIPKDTYEKAYLLTMQEEKIAPLPDAVSIAPFKILTVGIVLQSR